jgi:DNA repair protein RecO (recombination protein O)
MDRGYVLHTYPYRETSLILQAWTEKHGRIGLVAKGARRPKSPQRAVLTPFQPLALDWFGRGELRTLKTAEPAMPAIPLRGQCLLSAFYLNELLLKLTTRDDPHERLYQAYDDAIAGLRTATPLEPVLRRFELALLQELGYAVELTREAGTHAPIAAEREYLYVVERGPIPAAGGEERADAIRLRGLTLLDLERGRFEDPVTIAQAKSLMRLLINHSLNGQELATRTIVRDLQLLEETVARPSPRPSPKGEGEE